MLSARIHRSLFIALSCSFLSGACASLTDVGAPDVIEPGALENPAGAESLRVGAISRFINGFAGSADLNQVAASALISDELGAASFGSIISVDQRTPPDPEPTIYYPYLALQRAHVNGLQAIETLLRVSPSRRSAVGQLFALVGYTKVFFGENMCSGIPISPILNGQPTFGDPLSTAQLLERAIADFDSALAYGMDSARILNLARVGKARALLNAARFADAAAVVGAVPTAYVYSTDHSAAVQPNGFFSVVNNQRSYTVADRDGQTGLPFVSAGDPRVTTQFLGKGADRVTDVYGFGRYTSLASAVTLASGLEARLIEAEAALRNGATTEFLNILNALRADPSLRARYGIPAGALPPLTQPATEPERVDMLFRERAFWMFGTGHRQGDLRRLVRQYGRGVETVFPTGVHKQGQAFGPHVTFTPDAGELTNPNYSQCAHRAP